MELLLVRDLVSILYKPVLEVYMRYVHPVAPLMYDVTIVYAHIYIQCIFIFIYIYIYICIYV